MIRNPFKKKTLSTTPKLDLLKRIFETPTEGNWKGDIYAERLVAEWLEHGKIVLAVDFDDTIYGWKFKGFEANVHFKKLMNLILLAQGIGCYISIWSACAPDRYDEIRVYCESNGIRVDSINQNPIDLPYGNNRKMYYNHLLDDRAGLQQAASILEYVCYRVKSERKQPTQNFDV